MKRFTVLSLVGLLVLAFGTAVYAQAPKMEFKASGFIDAQFNSFVNATTGSGAAPIVQAMPSAYMPQALGIDTNAYNDNVSYWMTRARLKFDWIMGKETSATILFEMDSDRWGDPSGDRNRMGFWSGDRAAVEVKNVYFDFGVPVIPVPVSMRVGLQPLAVRPNLVVYTDGMGITSNIKVDPMNFQLLYFKALEGVDETADDVTVYGLHGNVKLMGAVTAGGYALYYNLNSYPFGNLNNNGDFWWFGLYADGKVGPVNLNFDFIYNRGEVEPQKGSIARDVKYRGWATRLKLDFPWEKFNFGVVGAYGSGADLKKTSSLGLPGQTAAFGAPFITTKVGSYVTPPGSESGAIFGESVVMFSFWGNRGTTGIANHQNYTQVSRGMLGGVWMGKLYGSFKATPWYKVTFQGLYIGDTTKNGNTFGTAVNVLGRPRDDKSIGWEFDLINEIQIYKNLKFTLAGGYLFAGDALDFRIPGTILNDSPKNPWNITGNLTLSF